MRTCQAGAYTTGAAGCMKQATAPGRGEAALPPMHATAAAGPCRTPARPPPHTTRARTRALGPSKAQRVHPPGGGGQVCKALFSGGADVLRRNNKNRTPRSQLKLPDCTKVGWVLVQPGVATGRTVTSITCKCGHGHCMWWHVSRSLCCQAAAWLQNGVRAALGSSSCLERANMRRRWLACKWPMHWGQGILSSDTRCHDAQAAQSLAWPGHPHAHTHPTLQDGAKPSRHCIARPLAHHISPAC